jgi:orotidine-5'-phosphate decarboxylase
MILSENRYPLFGIMLLKFLLKHGLILKTGARFSGPFFKTEAVDNLLEEARKRLIVAVDVPSTNEAERIVNDLRDHVGMFKIGLELLFAGGADLAWRLARNGQRVFVDAKLHDIPNTVERAVAQIAAHGAAFLTVHAQDRKMLEAAVRGRGNNTTRLLGVTVLTHLDTADISDAKPGVRLADIVSARARIAREAGLDGVICSPQEAARLRMESGPDFLIVTPGIRSAAAPRNDQSRVATAGEAIAAGADYLVVGRPILQAADPRAAADAFTAEIAEALAARAR